MTGPDGTARRLAARLGLFAVLFQALLFGWHHHDLTFAGRLPAPVIEKPTAAPQVADSEDGCEICQVLHHLTAAPVAFHTAPSPLGAVSQTAPAANAFVVGTFPAAFHPRAPPFARAAVTV